MKIWMFYRTFKGRLEPNLYAFTNKESRAKEFSLVRRGLAMLVKNASKKEYDSLVLNFENLEIIPDELLTRKEPGSIELVKVRLYVTLGEAQYFKCNMQHIATTLLGRHAFDTSLFTWDATKLLDQFGVGPCREAMNYVPDMVEFYMGIGDSSTSAQLFDGEYHLDELAVFREYHIDTFGVDLKSKDSN